MAMRFSRLVMIASARPIGRLRLDGSWPNKEESPEIAERYNSPRDSYEDPVPADAITRGTIIVIA